MQTKMHLEDSRLCSICDAPLADDWTAYNTSHGRSRKAIEKRHSMGMCYACLSNEEYKAAPQNDGEAGRGIRFSALCNLWKAHKGKPKLGKRRKGYRVNEEWPLSVHDKAWQASRTEAEHDAERALYGYAARQPKVNPPNPKPKPRKRK